MATGNVFGKIGKTMIAMSGGKVCMAVMISSILISQPVTAAPNGTQTADGYEITVAAGDPDVTLNSDDISALGTSTALIKKGGGRLIINTNMSDWSGNFGISNGYVRLSQKWADGKEGTGTLRLEPDATIELSGSANMPCLRRRYIYVGGTGVNGAGAVYSTASDQSQLFRCTNVTCELRLTADTLFKCSPTMGPSAGTMYFNGHKLTVDSGTFEMRAETVYGPGELHATNNCMIWMENSTPALFYKKQDSYVWGDGDQSVIRLGSGSSIKQSPQAIGAWYPKRCEWDIVCEGDASLISAPQSNTGRGFYGFYGLIDVDAGGTLTFDVSYGSGSYYSMNVTNILSCGGNVIVKSASAAYPGTLNLSNPNSTIAGSLAIQDGVTVNCASPLPCITNGTFTFVATKGGGLNIDMSAADLDDNGIYAAWKNVNDHLVWPVKGGAFDKFFAFGCDFGSNKTFSRTLSEPLVISHGGTGSLTIASSANGMQNYINYGGNLTLAGQPGENFKVGWIDVRGGTVTIPAGTYAEAENTNSVTIGADYPDIARFAVKGTYVNKSTNGSSWGGLYPGRNYLDRSDIRRGIIEVFDGAVVTNRIDGGASASGKATHEFYTTTGWQGSYFQHGGTFTSISGAQYFGSYQNMYVSIENGKFVSSCDNTRMGRRPGVTSFIDITGGTFETTVSVGAGQEGAQATVCVSGRGRFTSSAQQYFPRKDNENKNGGSHAVFAVDGEYASAESTVAGNYNAFVLSGQYNSIGEVNLNNGGTISANGFYKVLKYNTTDYLNNNIARVAFNGGILRTTQNYTNSEGKGKIFRNFTAGTDHVYIYAGGATIDTDGRDLAVGASLEAPSGNGVEAIPLPAAITSLKAWDYIAAPAVTITDPTGTGTGATAVAIYDTTAGRVTGFRVLNRGNNYTSAQATITKGGYTNTFTVACTVTPNVSGGLTKKGAGKLVLDCANTYTGVTVVAGGTLVSSNAAALTSTCALRLEGGTLDLTTQDISDLASVDEVVLAGGAIVNDAGSVTLPTGKCALDLAAAKVGNATTVTSAMTLPSSFNLLNGDLAAKADRSYTLLILPENYSGPIPVVTDVPVPWNVSVTGRKVRMVYPAFQISFR